MRARKIAQWIKALAVKPAALSLILETHIVERENLLLQVSLWHTLESCCCVSAESASDVQSGVKPSRHLESPPPVCALYCPKQNTGEGTSTENNCNRSFIKR